LRRPWSDGHRHLAWLTVACLTGCSSTGEGRAPGSDAGKDARSDARTDARRGDAAPGQDSSGATTLVLDLNADTTKPASFYATPFPSDLRLNSAGAPDYSGFPNSAGSLLVSGLLPLASSRKGFSTLSVAYFQFTGPLAPLDPTKIIPAGKGSNILLVDVDETSADRGSCFPTVAWTPPADAYTAANVLAVTAQPGFVLSPSRKYAFVVLREQNDANGNKLGVDTTLAILEQGKTPPGTNGAAAATLYAPLFDTLKTVGIAATDVAAATVFTTGDEVAVTAAMSSALVTQYPVTIEGLSVTLPAADAGIPDAGSSYPRICELQGTVTMPQFQQGTAPFATSGGNFQLGPDGVPVKQGDVAIPIAISLPTTGPMPAAGYPLVLYFHGSGGVSTEFVDRGPVLVPDGGETPGQGPAYVLAPFGFAMAGAALPQNPQRVPGAGETEYIQVGNLASLLGIFREGVIEQRIFLAALASLTIDPSLVAAGCPAVSVPQGQMIHFDPASFFSQGQSMGGMYTNLITAVEPKFRAALPTGAGGFWTYFLFQSAFVANANGLLEVGLGVSGEQLNFMHPALSMGESAIEGIDPIVSAPRLSRNPLPGTTPRPIYEPVGQNDSYFSNDTYDQMALAYGHREVGQVIWPSMQTELTEEGLGGIVTYPASNEVRSGAGSPYTGVVVQYNADPITGDGHYIYAQLDTVKYQYGCFFSTVLQTGTAVVPAPAALGTPCPLP